jgi:hypothetical protein
MRAFALRLGRTFVAACSLILASCGGTDSADFNSGPVDGGSASSTGGRGGGSTSSMGGRGGSSSGGSGGGSAGSGGSMGTGGATGGSTGIGGAAMAGGSGAGGQSAGASGSGGAGGNPGTGGSAGSAGAAGSGGAGGAAGSAGNMDASSDAPAQCMGSHPLLDGGARFCGPGSCYCKTKDACFSSATAVSCCDSDPVCASDGGLTCNGSHPLLDAGARFCSQGSCYCKTKDACYPSATAASCCDSDPVCAWDDGGTTCNGSHPLLDASARFCAPGYCRCVTTDACFPMSQITTCCAGTSVCF